MKRDRDAYADSLEALNEIRKLDWWRMKGASYVKPPRSDKEVQVHVLIEIAGQLAQMNVLLGEIAARMLKSPQG